jgi:hypothetical protein
MSCGKYVPASVLAVCCSVALVAVAMQAPMSVGATVAVLFPPKTALIDAVAAVGQAGGIVERTGRWGNIVVASFPGREPPVETLEASGAWLVFNAIAAGGCDPAMPQPLLNASSDNRAKSDRGLNT